MQAQLQEGVEPQHEAVNFDDQQKMAGEGTFYIYRNDLSLFQDILYGCDGVEFASCAGRLEAQNRKSCIERSIWNRSIVATDGERLISGLHFGAMDTRYEQGEKVTIIFKKILGGVLTSKPPASSELIGPQCSHTLAIWECSMFNAPGAFCNIYGL